MFRCESQDNRACVCSSPGSLRRAEKKGGEKEEEEEEEKGEVVSGGDYALCEPRGVRFLPLW